MKPGEVVLIAGISVVLLFVFFIAFRSAIQGKDGKFDKSDVLWPIYTLFTGIALFMGESISDFKFACLIGGSVGIEFLVTVVKVWQLKKDKDGTAS
jgi:hypothetical protein